MDHYKRRKQAEALYAQGVRDPEEISTLTGIKPSAVRRMIIQLERQDWRRSIDQVIAKLENLERAVERLRSFIRARLGQEESTDQPLSRAELIRLREFFKEESHDETRSG